MSRNLCTSSCPKCGYAVKLSDIRGKPVEFRRYGPYVPSIGVRFDCQCGEVYFLMWDSNYKFWEDPSQAFEDSLVFPGGTMIPNTEKGKFVTVIEHNGRKHYENTGYFTLDLSYYESFDDEPAWNPEGISDTEKPAHLCEDDALDVQRVLP